MVLFPPFVLLGGLMVFGGLVMLGRKPASWRLYLQSVAVAFVVLVAVIVLALFGPGAEMWP